MANRYWVGGTGTWSTTNTANWSDTSGGTGGFSVPTLSDDVFFDANSGTAPYTVTANNTSLACQNLDCTGFVGTLNTGSMLNVYGNLVLNSTMGFTGASGIYNLKFKATTTGKTVQPGGNASQGRLIFDGVGGEWTLGGAVSVPSSNGGIQVLAGTFITNGYSLYIGREGMVSSGTQTRSLQLGSSTITVQAGNWDITGSNVTVSHTGTLTCGNVSNAIFNGGGGSYGSVTVQVAAFDENNWIGGNNTFQNLTIGGAPITLSVDGNQTITGTFTCNGSGSTTSTNTTNWRMVKIAGISTGDASTDINPNAPQRTISAATFSVSYATFANIALTGAGAPLSGVFSDCGNNSGITFPTAKTVYARNTTSGTWNSNIRWSTTSGGAANTTVPLVQDTAILDANTGTGSIGPSTVFDIGHVDASAYSGTISLPTNTRVHGNFSIASTAIISGQLNLYGINDTTLNAANTLGAVQVRKATDKTVTLQSNITSSDIFYLNSGNFNLNTYNYSCTVFNSNYTNTRTINFSSGYLNVTGNATTVINIPNQNNLSWSGTGGVNLNYSGATGTRTITFGSTAGNSSAYSMPIAISAGSDIVAITSLSNFTQFPNTSGFTGTYSISRINIHGNKFFSVF